MIEKLIPPQYRALAAFIVILMWSAACIYGGWRWRDNEATAEAAQKIVEAAPKDQQQTADIGKVGEAFQGDKHEIDASKPVITVLSADSVCKSAGSGATRVPGREVSSGLDGRQAAPAAEDTALGEAVKSDADNYPLCYAALQRLREAVRASGSSNND